MSTITKIRTLRISERPNIIWVELETSKGLVGLGEVWRGAAAVEAVIHKDIAPWLIGQDSRRINYISHTLTTPYVGFHSSGAEGRAASAVDIALWDLCGKRHGIPVYEALGGAARKEVLVYNTCSGYSYNSASSNYDSGSARRIITSADQMQGPYDDQIAFSQDAGALAQNLLNEGYHIMKIWPFDIYAAKTQGTHISAQDLQSGLEPFRKIRDAVGMKIDIMCELHSLWSLPAAIEICRALEPYHIFWAEDPICKMDDTQSLAVLRAQTHTPICGSETLCGIAVFRQLLTADALDYAMVDLGWCGGLTEARKIAVLAESFNIPIAPHDCTGPVQLWAGLHLALHATNALFQEVVRANLATWYQTLVTELPIIQNGYIQAPVTPGLGVALRPEIYSRRDLTIHETVEKSSL